MGLSKPLILVAGSSPPSGDIPEFAAATRRIGTTCRDPTKYLLLNTDILIDRADLARTEVETAAQLAQVSQPRGHLTHLGLSTFESKAPPSNLKSGRVNLNADFKLGDKVGHGGKKQHARWPSGTSSPMPSNCILLVRSLFPSRAHDCFIPISPRIPLPFISVRSSPSHDLKALSTTASGAHPGNLFGIQYNMGACWSSVRHPFRSLSSIMELKIECTGSQESVVEVLRGPKRDTLM
jgi:hypothetical protein